MGDVLVTRAYGSECTLCIQVSQGISVKLDNLIDLLMFRVSICPTKHRYYNYTTEKGKRKGKSLKASFGNSTVENLPFLRYTTKKSMKIRRTRKTIPVNAKVVTRKPIKMVIIIAVK